jgi:hypothetical protein
VLIRDYLEVTQTFAGQVCGQVTYGACVRVTHGMAQCPGWTQIRVSRGNVADGTRTLVPLSQG